MNPKISLRPLRPSDSNALRQLFLDSPDTGKISIAAQYEIDPYQALTGMDAGICGVVAENSEDTTIVGLGLVRVGECQLNGDLSPYALLSNLIVHPEHRGQGIATQLAAWRIEYAQQKMGKDVAILASIQEKNASSMAAAARWSHQILGHYVSCALPVRQDSVKQSGFLFRIADESGLEAIAAGLNTFHQDYNLHVLETGKALAAWLQQSPLERPFRQYHVVTDKQDNILAGLAVTEQCRVVSMHVTSMPGWMNGLNKIVKMVPPDGVLRQLSVSKFWFRPGEQDAARALWEYIRYAYGDLGSHLTLSYDPRGPMSDILKVPFWLPKAQFAVYSAPQIAVPGEKLLVSL